MRYDAAEDLPCLPAEGSSARLLVVGWESCQVLVGREGRSVMSMTKPSLKPRVQGMVGLVLSFLTSLLVISHLSAQPGQEISYIDTHGHITLGIPGLPGG